MDLVPFRFGENNINTGPLKEIPEICVDHFLGSDLESSVFFLSHAHTDHLVGLETEAFLRRLNQPGVRLYCHPLTPILLGSFSRYLQGPDGIKKLIAARKIVPLDVEKPKKIRIPTLTGYQNVVVTLFPAGHCPGSVMFLFEAENIRILHTGDFRLEVDDLKRMPLLHKNKVPKQIDHLYIDTTFCSRSANVFPNRKKVLKEVFDHVQNWLNLSNSHIINLSFSAKFAHEYILLELHRIFGQKIHVLSEKLKIYEHIPEICKIVTTENETQFHLCGKRNCFDNGKILTLRFASMWFTKIKEAQRDSISWRGRNNINICYSMHSSLDEIGKTIDYLKPRVVTPLVLPYKTEISEVNTTLRSISEIPFVIEDYRSSRDDFVGVNRPETLCVEERDETDQINIEIETEDPSCDVYNDICTSTGEEETPTKRLKLSEEDKTAWRYECTPSPSSKYSQTSSEDGSQNISDGNHEVNSEGITEDEDFTKPDVPAGKLDPCRTLWTTDFNDCEENSCAKKPNFDKQD